MSWGGRLLGWMPDGPGWGALNALAGLAIQAMVVGGLSAVLPNDLGTALFFPGVLFCGLGGLLWGLPAWFWLRRHRPAASAGWAAAFALVLLIHGACYGVFANAKF